MAEKDKLQEVAEYVRLKASELKMVASETLEDEIQELQDVVKFAQRRLDDATGEAKEKIQQVIDFAQQKIDELKVQADLGTTEAKDIGASLSDQLNDFISDLQKSDITKRVEDVAKSVGGLIGNIGKKVGQGASNLSKTISIRTDLSRLNGKRRDLISKLGELVYKQVSETDSLVLNDQLLNMTKDIKKVEEDIKAKKEELERVGREENLSDEQINNIIKEADQD